MKAQKKYWETLDKLGQKWADQRARLQDAREEGLPPQKLQQYQEACNAALWEIRIAMAEFMIEKSSASTTFTGEKSQAIVLDISENRLKNFDPAKGNFSTFLNRIEHYAELDYLERQKKENDRIDSDVDIYSVGEDVEDDRPTEEETMAFFIRFFQVAEKIVESGKVSKAGFNYKKLVYTENVAKYIRATSCRDSYAFHHESEIFDCMELDYLDFFMEEPCRTVDAIEQTETQWLRLLLEPEALNENMAEKRCPLVPPQNVVISYLRRIRSIQKNQQNITSYRQDTLLDWIKMLYPDNPSYWARLKRMNGSGSEKKGKASSGFDQRIDQEIEKRKKELGMS